MRSKTSLCNRATLKTDITRFSPVWLLYTVGMLMAVMLIFGDLRKDGTENILWSFCSASAVIQFGYAAVTALCLFGYLYDVRLCYGFHSLPVTRGSLFFTHTVAGLLFSLVPNLLTTGLLLAACPKHTGLVLLWLAGATGQYLFFFSLGALCCFFAGSRLGAVMCYGMVNFLSMLVLWFTQTVFPSQYGIPFINNQVFHELFPLYDAIYHSLFTADVTYFYGGRREVIVDYPVQGRIALGAFVLLGVLFLLGAYLLYRRRNLECAGELIVVKPLKPVFLVIVSLATGWFIMFAASLFFGIYDGGSYVYLTIGIAVGYFGGRMLMERKVNVFRPGALPLLLGIFAALLLTMAALSYDVFGAVQWVPEAEDVQKVVVSNGLSIQHQDVTLNAPQDIQKLVSIHREEVDFWKAWRKQAGFGAVFDRDPEVKKPEITRETGSGPVRVSMEFTYTMKNGKNVTRRYRVTVTDETGELTPAGEFRESYITSVESILGVPEEKLSEFTSNLFYASLDIWYESRSDHQQIDQAHFGELVDAIVRDRVRIAEAYDADSTRPVVMSAAMDSYLDGPTKPCSSIRLDICENCENVLAFAEKYGYYTPEE